MYKRQADICPVSTEGIYPVSTTHKTAAGRRPAAVMSFVETGQMSAVGTGQMSAVETGQMSAAETGQMSSAETVSTEDLTAAGRRPAAVFSFVETG